MVRHFRCTQCGRCCYGLLPLTCNDAFAHADLFPLGFVWTALRPGSKDYNHTASLGAIVPVPGGTSLAVQITPTAFIPAIFTCPALREDNRCSLHDTNKPLRCRTMPLYPYREERFQSDVLTPRAGWMCDMSESAPVIFNGTTIVCRDDFDRELGELMAQVPLLRRYADYMLKYTPWLTGSLQQIAGKGGGTVVTSLSSFLTATRNTDAQNIARQQLPVLKAFVERTAGNAPLKEFHAHYVNWEKEMSYVAKRAP
ncbi:MAG: YkgJ family cysteine cluster protein [Spirochaetes bacterium]|nr:YkgJ family cysteine cluster protein [Spirochaetota bacterium]